MKRISALRSAVLFVVLALSALAVSGCKKASPEDEVNAAIDQAIASLGTRDYQAFLDRWPAPEDKKQLLEGSTLEKRAADFAGKPANKMVERLRAARAKAPSWNAEHTRATYAMGEMDPELVLEKFDGRWYIRN